MKQRVKEFLREGGLLSQILENYEVRPQQIDMAMAVADAIELKQHLVVEAATGTGKTHAYLIPALLSGKRVVVSTNTKTLQEQLIKKDIPQLEKFWPKNLKKFTAGVLKGRSNYLCLQKFELYDLNPLVDTKQDHDFYSEIKEWVQITTTGDCAELTTLSPHSQIWSSLTTYGGDCPGQKCHRYDECFLMNARNNAAKCDLIVVNHHLFYADLSIKEEGNKGLIPDFDTVVFDEAHHIEKIATDHFSTSISTSDCSEFSLELNNLLSSQEIVDNDLRTAIRDFETASEDYLDALTKGLGNDTISLDDLYSHDNGVRRTLLIPAQTAFENAIENLQKRLYYSPKLGQLAETYADRAKEFRERLNFLTEPTNENFINLVEKRGSWTSLRAAPIDLAPALAEKLIKQHPSIIFTSATLSAGHSLQFFRERIGLYDSDKLVEMILPEIFDYKNNCMLYVPSNLPAPKKCGDKFPDHVATLVEYLVTTTEGRAFILFTSYKNMNAVYELLKNTIPYKIFIQGDAPQNELLRRFREDTHSVLFATASFWEGVDVKGESLSLVVIDKLPFANISDPIVKARMNYLKSKGLSSFQHYMLPEAALTLKQGFGRLIRSKDDVGVVAILDSRLKSESYGQYLMNSLPNAMQCNYAREARGWWKTKHGLWEE